VFAAGDGVHGRELWVSDGTSAGTTLLEILPGAGSSDPWYLAAANGTLFFGARDATHGFEPWTSDGTPAGTLLLKDIVPRSGDSVAAEFTNVNGTVFFSADAGLWKTDGTTAGTVLVKDVLPGPGSGVILETPPVGSVLVFQGDDGVSGSEPWASDGRAANTHLVADVGSPGGSDPDPESFTQSGSLLFFRATTNATGDELFAVPIAALMDSDLDGLDYAAETAAGTNPFDADTDGDGFSDFAEVVEMHTDPLDPNDRLRTRFRSPVRSGWSHLPRRCCWPPRGGARASAEAMG